MSKYGGKFKPRNRGRTSNNSTSGQTRAPFKSAVEREHMKCFRDGIWQHGIHCKNYNGKEGGFK